VLLLFGIIEFSVAYNRAQALHAAAREGARLGSLPESDVGTIKSRVNDAFAGVTFDGNPVITVSSNGGAALPNTAVPCGPPALPNSTVEVKVTVPEEVDIPLMGARSVTLTGEGVFKCEV
jgi:Flp pilus assembly protein TadG